jgi:HlyD family secretion protein
MGISLPLVRVQGSVSGKGIIRPGQEKAKIIAGVSGLVEEVYVSEGEHVTMAAPILKLRSYDAGRDLQLLKMELRDTDQYIADLKGLTSDPLIPPAGQKYRSAYREFCQRMEYLALMCEKSDREWTRQTGLFRAGLISEKEFDDLTYTKARANQEKEHFLSETRRAWQDEYVSFLDRKRIITKQIQQTEERIRRSVIHAPVSGSLEEFSGIFAGSVLQAGATIGVISPDSWLIGEIYISSKDIAYIRTGQAVRIHIDALPSRDWGLARGEIVDISGDYIWLDQQAVYRVKCRFAKTKLALKNGYEGELMKGMTFQARCLVASRSLLQLLTDKVDDWLDPTINSRQTPALQEGKG